MAQLYAQYTAAMGAYGTGPLRALNLTTSTSSELSIARDVVLSGGRGGKNVKFLTGPPNSVVSGSAGRVFVTDSKGRVIMDINSTRVKPVTPGQGFGPKRAPTPYELKLIDDVHRGG